LPETQEMDTDFSPVLTRLIVVTPQHAKAKEALHFAVSFLLLFGAATCLHCWTLSTLLDIDLALFAVAADSPSA
jgi:hypothetical protein